MERWKRKLEQLINGQSESQRSREFEFKRIKSIVHAPSSVALIKELDKYVEKGTLKASYRVLSPITGSGLLERNSISEIPHEVYDVTTDRSFLVDPTKDMEIIYKSMRAS